MAEQAEPIGYPPEAPSPGASATAAGWEADATARAVIDSAADAIVAFGTDRTVVLWNPAAERMFGWGSAEVIGHEPPNIPEERAAEHTAVLERVRGGGQISFATRRIRKDGALVDVRIDTSALTGARGEVTGWVNICHETGELRPFVNIFLEKEDVRWLQGLDTPVHPGATVHIFHSVAGGA